MGANSEISWTDATFNPWWGCTKVGNSPACDQCYAETFAKRVGFSETGSQFPIWGADTERRFFGDKHWNEPLKWNRKAELEQRKKFVFCASMSDWAEGMPDQKPHLQRLWTLQEQTEWLTWLMLTKRPQLIDSLCPIDRGSDRRWFGITTETQFWFDNRWAHLKRVYSPVYWLSVEPLFERLILPDDFLQLGQRAWVIVGGESGHSARPIDPEWVRALRDQCIAANVPFHFKQWGEWLPGLTDGAILEDQPRILNASDAPIRTGKHKAGDWLDGRQWKQFPEVRA